MICLEYFTLSNSAHWLPYSLHLTLLHFLELIVHDQELIERCNTTVEPNLGTQSLLYFTCVSSFSQLLYLSR